MEASGRLSTADVNTAAGDGTLAADMDVWDYFDRVERECDDRSLRGVEMTYSAVKGSNDQEGRILGALSFELDDVCTALLHVAERVRIEDDRPNVFEYAYFLVVDGVEFGGWEIDLSHDPAVHRHTRDHRESLEAEPTTLPRMIDWAWVQVSDYVRQLQEAAGEEG